MTSSEDAFWRETWGVDQRLVTIVVTVRTNADDNQLTDAITNGLSFTDAKLVGCDWAPDPDTIADNVDPLNPDEADLHHVTVLDLNPAREDVR